MLAITSNRNGNMTIYVDKTTTTKTLSLSESISLSNPSGKLYGPSLTNAWDEIEDNIPSYSDLLDGDTSARGEVSKESGPHYYVAYTFYLHNSGMEALNYSMGLNIEYVDKDADSMIRVRIYEDGQPVTYAKLASNGEPEYRTEPFYDEDTVIYREYNNFQVNQVRKYSVVIWIEADDPDTTNDKIGGSLVMSMKFDVTG